MGKPQNGPSLEDVYVFAAALEQHSLGIVHITMQPRTAARVAAFSITTTLTVRTGPQPTDCVVLAYDGIYPNNNYATLEAELLSHLYALDKELARMWQQAKLPMP